MYGQQIGQPFGTANVLFDFLPFAQASSAESNMIFSADMQAPEFDGFCKASRPICDSESRVKEVHWVVSLLVDCRERGGENIGYLE